MSFYSTPKGKTKEELDKTIARRNKVNLTAYARRGKKLKSVEALLVLASRRKSVYCCNCMGLLPAAVVANMSAALVHRMITDGDVHEYHPKGGKK